MLLRSESVFEGQPRWLNGFKAVPHTEVLGKALIPITSVLALLEQSRIAVDCFFQRIFSCQPRSDHLRERT